MEYLKSKKQTYSSRGSHDNSIQQQLQHQHSEESYRHSLFVESKISLKFSDFSIHEFETLCKAHNDSIKLLELLILASLSSAKILLILDHANSLTKSGSERHEDCTTFLDFIDRLLSQKHCSGVRVSIFLAIIYIIFKIEKNRRFKNKKIKLDAKVYEMIIYNSENTYFLALCMT